MNLESLAIKANQQQSRMSSPSAEVTGVDLSPIQPGWIPPNLSFIIDDVTREWSFQTESFDFIHVRCFAGSIEDWSTFLKRCYRYLKPGGRIEVAEYRAKLYCDDGSCPEDSYLYKWEREFDRITEIQGRDWDIAPKLPSLLRETSFETVDTIEHVCPFGTWPKDPKLKEVGRYFRAQMVEGAMESYSLALFTRFGGWRPVEVQVLLAHLRAEIQSNKIHAYSKLAFVTAQKPKK
ncbi:uncharacterized protein N7458_000060 [Penicillium daleae]|uniref:Methyltransferase type 11 domain-containing protein n=1 Tax=Penicillium daleae TaxID=63821 RepID=A0AAD6CF79_9EURO|nr:uncharacterized protein N7458_000060 [Penicillium daleae]KAJ5464374.1 hypothetical protein N7458_000060 [Penicillium daleae]